MTMKHTLLVPFIAVAITAPAQDLPMPSPKGEVEQVVGLTKVEVEYHRPSAKGRKVFGDLVPYGELWRTGANRASTIEFDGPVVVEGIDVPAGEYSIFTIPGTDSWVVAFNRNLELWGTDGYKEEEDVARFKVTPAACEHVETLTFLFDAVKDDQAVLELRWEKTRVPLVIKADATERALANIAEALAKPDADFRAYHNSARFCIDRDIKQKEALEWARTSVNKEKKFWNVHTLALAQAANGQYKEAVATAEESLKMAQEVKYEAYVKMNKEKIDEWTRLLPPAKGGKK